MKHTYEITSGNNVMVDGKHIIKTSESLDGYERENQAHDIIDYILENEDSNLTIYLPWYAVIMSKDDTDWGTGSFDLEEAQTIAKRLEADHIEKIVSDVCDEIIEIK